MLHVVRQGAIVWTLNVSTGTGKPYRVNGRTEVADTPDGEWTVSRAYDGLRAGELGSIYRPRYFHRDGIAVHGFASVPASPRRRLRTGEQAGDGLDLEFRCDAPRHNGLRLLTKVANFDGSQTRDDSSDVLQRLRAELMKGRREAHFTGSSYNFDIRDWCSDGRVSAACGGDTEGTRARATREATTTTTAGPATDDLGQAQCSARSIIDRVE